MEDSRFTEIKRIKKKDAPHSLHWFMKEEVFSEELFGFFSAEVNSYKSIALQAYTLFEKATSLYLEKGNLFGIPTEMFDLITYTWNHKEQHPFLIGRFDINGGLDNLIAKVIEFNADTCSTFPETALWQDLQLQQLKGKTHFNELKQGLVEKLSVLKSKIPHEKPIFLATSLGYIEDQLNCNIILDAALEAGFTPRYADLPDVIFGDDGIFLQFGDEYEPVDVFFKMFPWDWIYNEEPDLLNDLSYLIKNNKVMVVNPPYTSLWQNKQFLTFITDYFPNEVIAKTYNNHPNTESWVEKPILGRIGENITIKNKQNTYQSKGDYENQSTIYQEYLPLAKDVENYYYQIGIFFSDRPLAINLRCQEQPIITEDAEFMSHYIL
ncbi:glutathionylspermidine synthase family protein [Tenacibaculum tangerinum]|uniref:Glutathionylspermidine synthase family protein n=1 Tax=Tenacibaculum tangerinum TaxID=3038772 RepID=A0ABY8L255_9FLAO|nr:glutathionylspermidine synthase family protein [Tenacibaculum tangerinum]WGH75519.1 glutathionylspermidine synthase family protein [Tenacibaculum tangerinum]